jgi:ferredoxin
VSKLGVQSQKEFPFEGERRISLFRRGDFANLQKDFKEGTGKRMGRPAWQIKIITLLWPFRNLLAGMVGWPIIGRWMRRAFRGDQAAYIPVGVEVNPPGSMVVPTQMVEQFIRESSFRFILAKCLCRSLESCRKYPAEMGCLFLGEGAREIAPSLGREATCQEALAHHRKAVALGLIPMMGKLKWDSIWLGVKRAGQLLTICHCCECCCYFRVYRFLPPEAAGGLQKLKGLEVRVSDGCDGCGICVDQCFIEAMTLKNGKALPGEACRGCGRCATACPKGAIQVVLSDSQSQVRRQQAASALDAGPERCDRVS